MKSVLTMASHAFVLAVFALFSAESFGQGVPFPEVGKAPAPAYTGPAFGPIDAAPAPPSPLPVPKPAEAYPMTGAPVSGLPDKVAAGKTFQRSAAAPATIPSRPPQGSPLTGLENRPIESRQNRPEMLQSVVDRNHPFAFYFEPPKDPQSMIKGKPYRVARLLEGVRNVNLRKRLLQNYWELAGILVEYNTRIDAERHLFQWLGEAGNDPQRRNPLHLAFQLSQQERKTVEIEFVKSQWKLASLLRQAKGETFGEGESPIPCDFPLYKKYETYAEKIARTDRARYFGHLIPFQEELISAKMIACRSADDLLKGLPKNVATNGREMISALNQRTGVFVELIESVVEYNSMIAEYTTETIGPGVSSYRLVGALIELPNFDPKRQHTPEGESPSQLATPGSNLFGYQTLPEPEMPKSNDLPPRRPEPPPTARREPPESAGIHPRYATEAPSAPKPTFAPEPTSDAMFPPSEIVPASHFEEKREKEPAPFQSIAPRRRAYRPPRNDKIGTYFQGLGCTGASKNSKSSSRA